MGTGPCPRAVADRGVRPDLLTNAGNVKDVEAALAARLARQQLIYREDSPIRRPNIDVNVIPAGSTHPGVNGSFVVATVDGRTVGFVDGPLGGTVVESMEGTARLDEVWERVRGCALPVDLSHELITKVAEQWT